MKQIFKPIPLILLSFSGWVTWVCASLLEFHPSGNLIAHNYGLWGDWSAHFTFISALKERGLHFVWGDNPLFSGASFQYPFLSHALTWLFSFITGLDVIHATYISSLILIFILPWILFRVFCKIGLNALPALLSTLTFLLMGGLQWLDSSLNPQEPLTNQFDHASIVTQFILYEFMPQRAFLFGLVTFCALLLFCLKTRKWTAVPLLVITLGCAFLTLLHVHTWVAMGTLLLCLCLTPPKTSGAFTRVNLFKTGVGILLISLGLLAFLLLRGDHRVQQNSWELWFPGWAQNPKANLKAAAEMNFFHFWIFNTGLYLPLAGAGIWLSRFDLRLRAWWLAGTLLFILAATVNIQPYFYDNLKIFTYSFFFYAPFVGIALSSILRVKPGPRAAKWVILLAVLSVQVFSAVSDLVSFSHQRQSAVFFTREEISLAQEFKKVRLSSDGLVLINPKHNHWLPCLSGNPVVLGYEGWLWSWGINYGARDAQVREVFKGSSLSAQIIKDLGVSYIAFQSGDKMGADLINQDFFDQHYSKVLSQGSWQVYSTLNLISPSTSVR